MYDFANQPFTTLVVTFIYGTFFTKVIAENEIVGTMLWSRGITITAIIVALLSPIMGAIADRGGYRKLYLIFWTWVSIIGALILWFPVEGQVVFALTAFIIGNVGFEMGGVFCNAFLPEITTKKNIGRVSGYGWSFGYVGGLVAHCAWLFCTMRMVSLYTAHGCSVRCTLSLYIVSVHCAWSLCTLRAVVL